MLLGPKIALISTALFSLTSFSGIADNRISSETLRQLDPSRIAGSICGQSMRDVRSRLNWIRIANLAAGAVQAAGICHQHAEPACAALFQSGPDADLWLQSCRGHSGLS